MSTDSVGPAGRPPGDGEWDAYIKPLLTHLYIDLNLPSRCWASRPRHILLPRMCLHAEYNILIL